MATSTTSRPPPAESTSYRLAKHDRERWPDILSACRTGEAPYYTNSSNLPVDFTSDVFDALDIQDQIQTLYTSGTVFHAFLGEKLPDWKAAASLVKAIAENYRLPYYTMSPTYSICQDHGYMTGEVETCPHCGGKCEIYSRITGYYRPISNWNDGKAREYRDRVTYRPELSQWGKPDGEGAMPAVAAVEDAKKHITYLFTTKTCPNCKTAKDALSGMDYTTVDAEENMELAAHYGIMQAPALVVIRGGEPQKYINYTNIRKYVEQEKMVMA